jgi:hypothetical protein
LAALILAVAAGVDLLAAHNAVRHLVPVALVGYAFAGAALVLLFGRLPHGAWAAAAAALALVVVPNLSLSARADDVFRRLVADVDDVRLAAEGLAARGLSRGYGDYWAAYPITYFAGERIVVAPALPTVWGGRFDRYPAYAARVDAVDDPRQLFVLVDRRCVPTPYVEPLAAAGASYRLETVGGWYLVWDVRPLPSTEASTLVAWRSVITSHNEC